MFGGDIALAYLPVGDATTERTEETTWPGSTFPDEMLSIQDHALLSRRRCHLSSSNWLFDYT